MRKATHTPPRQLLQQALRLARRRNRSIFVYRHDGGWAITEKLPQATGVTTIEIAPDRASPETRNLGGC